MPNRPTSRASKNKRFTGKKTASVLSDFSVAIVEPEFGINLGYLARTAANFGMRKLLVISKRKLGEKNFSEAALFAAHGRHLIEELEYVLSIESLKRKFKVLIGTTAIEARRKSNLTRRTLSPEECARMVFKRLVNGEGRKSGACFVFGRDTTGLTNEELRGCDYSLTIRTLSDYNTLNVSHAAAIIFYAFASAAARAVSERESSTSERPSTSSRKERERTVSLFLQLAQDSEIQSFKLDLLRESLERMLNRSDPSLRELYLLMGLASRAGSKIRRLSVSSS